MAMEEQPFPNVHVPYIQPGSSHLSSPAFPADASRTATQGTKQHTVGSCCPPKLFQQLPSLFLGLLPPSGLGLKAGTHPWHVLGCHTEQFYSPVGFLLN